VEQCRLRLIHRSLRNEVAKKVNMMMQLKQTSRVNPALSRSVLLLLAILVSGLATGVVAQEKEPEKPVVTTKKGYGGRDPFTFVSTAPQNITVNANDMENLQSLLRSVTDDQMPTCPTHPIFGPMSRPAWLRWAYLHADHHLRQFGV